MKWISVDDKVPEDENPVLVYYFFKFKDGSVRRIIGICRYYAFASYPYWSREGIGAFVTHWMPLPSPPELKECNEK